MPQFRKKPVVIEAVQFEWQPGRGVPDIPGVKFERWTVVKTPDGLKDAPIVESAYIMSLEGKLHVTRGDWIITGVQGERYPCKPDVFALTYEPVITT